VWGLVGNGLKKGRQIARNTDCLSRLVIHRTCGVPLCQAGGGGRVVSESYRIL